MITFAGPASGAPRVRTSRHGIEVRVARPAPSSRVRRLPHAPAVLRLACGRVRSSAQRAELPGRAGSGRRDLPERSAAGGARPTTTCSRSACRSPRRCSGHGTTAFEMKTGYGLSVEAELRQLGWPDRWPSRGPPDREVTLLACHAVPEGWDRDAWVDGGVHELIPAAAGRGLADAVDVYVEDIAFSVDDLRRVAEAAAATRAPAFDATLTSSGWSGAAEAAVAAGRPQRRPPEPRRRRGRRGAGGPGVALGDPSGSPRPAPDLDDVHPGRTSPRRCLAEPGRALASPPTSTRARRPACSMPEVLAAAAALYRLRRSPR